MPLSPVCNLCHFPIQEAESFYQVDQHGNFVTPEPIGSPMRLWPSSREGSQLFRYHSICVKTPPTALPTASLLELGQALSPALPVDDPSKSEHAHQLVKRSRCPPVSALESTTYCDAKEDCKCLKCIFWHLSSLPQEIFSEIIVLAKPSKVQNILLVLGETPRLLSELQRNPARDFSISCQGDIFETSFEYGGKSYITNLYDHEITGSKKIKSKDVTCDYVIVWLDKIGLTKVEFVHSEALTLKPGITRNEDEEGRMSNNSMQIECRNCPQICHSTKLCPNTLSKREWVYAVAITGKRVWVRSKGVFLERITGSPDRRRQVFLDCSQSPMILQPEYPDERPSSTLNPSKDLVLRHVPVRNASALSVAFSSGRISAIMSHRRGERRLSLYDEVGECAVWTHFPLSNDENILAIWMLRHRNREMTLETSSLVKTQRKVVWLGPFMSSRMHSKVVLIPIANHSICALHFNDPRSPYTVVGATPLLSSEEKKRLPPPYFPTYRTSFPECVTYSFDMFYSEAPLEGLVKVQLCMDAEYCIGILLHYETYSKTVGQIRYDKEISGFREPWSVGLVQERDVLKTRIHIKRFDEQATEEETKNLYLRLMKGTIVWWYGKEFSVVTVAPHDTPHPALSTGL